MRRTYRTGNISFDKTANRIVARIRIDGRIKKKTFPKNRTSDAERWLAEMSEMKFGIVEFTVGEYLRKYIDEYKKPFVRPRSFVRIEQSMKKWEPLFNVKLSELTASQIQREINSMTDMSSASTIKKSAELLKSALNNALFEQLIRRNPALNIRIPKTEKQQIEIFSPRELGKIFLSLHELKRNKRNTSQRYDMELFFRMLLFTGVRVSELLSLRYENIDRRNRTIKIECSKSMNDQTLNEPKTKAGHRVVPVMSRKTFAMLTNNDRRRGFVFENKNGGMMNYQRAFLTWENVRKRTGIEKRIHCFRHSFVSYLLYLNFPIADVSEMAGHNSPTVTFVYTHSLKQFFKNHGTHSGHIPLF